MKKLIDFLKDSNHWKHLIGGFLVALGAMVPLMLMHTPPTSTLYAMLYATLVAGMCLELKDHLWGGKWDWTDLAVTLLGGIICSWYVLYQLLFCQN